MSVSNSIRLTVRRRGNFACEYCGVTEESTGGELNIDHFRPQSKNGGDELDNLVYCYIRCNLYKGEFWVESSDASQLWNPRYESFEKHFWQAENGRLFALTETGELTLRVLRLNRPQLIAYRQNQFLQNEKHRLLEASESAMEIMLQLNQEQRNRLRAQKTLLDEQRRLLNLLLDNTDS